VTSLDRGQSIPPPVPAVGPPEAASAGGLTTIYSGSRHSTGATFVTANGRPLDARTDLRKESATAFDWGYEGCGAPAQLALAILAHHLADDGMARRYNQHFVRSVIRGLPSARWTMTGTEIDAVLPASVH
jgi:hypothetical protein